MTELLQQAIAQVNNLPDSDQNAIGADQAEKLLDQLSTTRAEIFSPQADQAAVQALSDHLIAQTNTPIANPPKAKRKLSDFYGVAPNLLGGVDAQEWVNQSR